MWLMIIGCLVVLLLLYHPLKDIYLVHFCGFPPGPYSLPLLGNMHLLSIKYAYISITELGKNYGKIFSLRLGPMGRVVMVQDMKLITQVFEHPDCNDRPPMKIFDVISNGFNGIGSCAYNKRWKEITQIFHKGMAKLSHSSLQEKVNYCSQNMFERISASKLGTEYYPKEDVHNTFIGVFASLVYGIEPEQFSSQDLALHTRDHRTLFKHLNPLHPVNVCPPLINLPLPGIKRLMECCEIRDKAMHASYMSHRAGFTGQIHDIMDIIVNYFNDKDSGKVTPESRIQLPDVLLSSWTMYLAGCQTVVDTIMWSILYLSHFKHVQRAMQEEIDCVSHRMTTVLEEKSSLHYTRAAILEIIRLSTPNAMGIPKYTAREIKLGQYTIPKGTQIMATQWPIHHDEEYWPEPFQLKPERFLDEDGKLLSYQHIFHKMPYLPFSFGKRPCLGKLLSLDMLLIFMVSMLQKYDLSLPDGYVPILKGEMLFNLEPARNPVVMTER